MSWLDDAKESIKYGIDNWKEMFLRAPIKTKLLIIGFGFLASLNQFFDQAIGKVNLREVFGKISLEQATVLKLVILVIGIPLTVIGTIFFLAYIQTILNKGYRKGVVSQYAKTGLVLGLIFSVLVIIGDLDTYLEIPLGSDGLAQLTILAIVGVLTLFFSLFIAGPAQLLISNIVIVNNLGIKEAFNHLLRMISKKPNYFLGHMLLALLIFVTELAITFLFIIIISLPVVILSVIGILGTQAGLSFAAIIIFLIFALIIGAIINLGIVLPIQTGIWIRYLQLWNERAK